MTNQRLDPAAEESWRQHRGLIVLFPATILLSAFLLFQVQPMIGKYILPWFGSAPGVWATALLFFQLTLLCGYAYAHFIVSHLTWRRQALLHGTLLLLALVALPVTPSEALRPTNPDSPIGRILLILTLSVGAPFFLLSTTAPLLQRWFAHLIPSRSPYRLYSLSNLGSLLALLSYPLLIERFVRLRVQTSMWSLGYVLFAGLCGACAWVLTRSPVGGEPEVGSVASKHGGVAEPEAESEDRPGVGTAILWLSLSACGSGLLLATTNQMSLDIAVIPFLWIVPLSLYLLTFVLCFDSDGWYVRPLYSALLPLVLINAVRLLYLGIGLGIVDQVVGYALTLFVCCMCCHGELARMRPTPRHLTFFFLILSIGGALGGLFVAVLAPTLFRGLYEYQILLIVCYGLVFSVQVPKLFGSSEAARKSLVARVSSAILWEIALAAIMIGSYKAVLPITWYGSDASSNLVATFASWQAGMFEAVPYCAAVFLLVFEGWRRSRSDSLRVWWLSGRGVARLGVSAMLAVGLWSLTGGLVWQIRESERRLVVQDRNFYGVLSINERDVGAPEHRISLTHGRVRHGQQLQEYPGWPTTYYGPETGVGLALRYHPARTDPGRQFRVGVVGLGVGTLAAYANTRIDPDRSEESYVVTHEGRIPDYIRFYELNPLVIRWADERFTFLRDADARGADIDVFEGDARIVLELQLERGEGQRFDVLAIDAFSSDAIPIHLLTQESFQIYLRHLQEGGILALHLTNRHVDLIPIVGRLAAVMHLNAIYIENDESESRLVNSTDWVLLTSNRAFLNVEAIHEDEVAMPEPGPLWTDDFSSIFEVVEFND